MNHLLRRNKYINKVLLIIFLFILVINGCNTDPQVDQPAKATKVVFIILDGIPTDVIKEIETPAIENISNAGGFTKAHVGGEKGGYSETPTISSPGYNSLLTGTWANKHNVWGNEIKDPNYHYWSIFRLIEEMAPNKKTAIFSTWTDNRTELIGIGKKATGNLHLDYHFDGFENDTVSFPHDEQSHYIRDIDEHVAAEAARYIKESGPDLSWVYLQYTDNMGHKYGDSPQFYKSVRHADKLVKGIWKAVQYRMSHKNEDWLIIVTTDHGRDAKTGKGHGGQTPRERTTWITTNASNLNSYFKQQTPGIVDIYPTITRFMGIKIPVDLQRELDGIPLIGPVSVYDFRASYNKQNHTIDLQWNVMDPEGSLDILLTTTNKFKTGGEDQYKTVKTVPVDSKTATIKVEPSSYYKIVLQSPYNTVNQWIAR